MDAYQGLSLAYLEGHPAAAAAVLDRVAPADGARLLAAATSDVAARVLGTMAPLAASACLLALPPDRAAAMVEAMPPAIAAALMRRMPGGRAEDLLGAIAEARARAIRGLLRYREGLVGAMVDPAVPGLPVDQRAADALAWLRAHSDRTESAVFLVNRDHTLAGVLPLQALLVAGEAAPLESIGRPVTAALPAASPLSRALASAAWWESPLAPVIDEDGRYLGALHYGTLRHLADADRSPPPPLMSIHTLVSLGELYWSGTGHVIAALAAAASPRPPARSPRMASGTGSTADDGAHAGG